MAVAGLKRGQTGGEGDYQCLLHCMVTNTYPFHMNPLTRVEPEFDSGSTRLLRSHARVEPGFDPGKQPEFDPAQE